MHVTLARGGMVEGQGWASEQCPLSVTALFDLIGRKTYRGKNIMPSLLLSLLLSLLSLLLLSRNSTQWLWVITNACVALTSDACPHVWSHEALCNYFRWPLKILL